MFRDETTPQAHQRATRTIFFVAGLAMASWAPLIPFVKTQLAASEATLGLLLFCIAAGSMSMMTCTGWLIQRFGFRRLIIGCVPDFVSICRSSSPPVISA